DAGYRRFGGVLTRSRTMSTTSESRVERSTAARAASAPPSATRLSAPSADFGAEEPVPDLCATNAYEQRAAPSRAAARCASKPVCSATAARSTPLSEREAAPKARRRSSPETWARYETH